MKETDEGGRMKQAEKTLIQACGGYCANCPDYLAYINNDEKLKEQLAGQFSKQFGIEIKAEDVGCLGYHGTIHKPWCASCNILQYTEEKGILTCAFCAQFPCDKSDKYYKKHEGRMHILRQKKIGLEEWLEEMRKTKKHSC